MNIALFVSGDLGLNVLEHLKRSKDSIKCVFTDLNSRKIIDISNCYELPVFIGNPRNEDSLKFIDDYDIEVILSVNYLFIIERSLFSKSNLAVNIHGSLLPKYRGRTPHVWAIINNEVKTGITAHLIDDRCDSGDIIRQEEIIIGNYDTGADLLEKFKIRYLSLVDKVLADYKLGRLTFLAQKNENATVFGKRTPDDGRIDWSWQKERIRNWVRAQAHPYPGAFTYLEDQKIIIDEVVFSDLGFDGADHDGLILSLDPICVKTPNGVLELRSVRRQVKSSLLEVGKRLV